ncbi:unnamed protein product [Peniophora sp. CBMAI 1063]|nr:unnamed protein product [Peniophora sp. CBMAI 1063]
MLAHGRRYGIISRNGVDKLTQLRHIAVRDVPIPEHITILFVEQEIIGDDTIAMDSVLKADGWCDQLLCKKASLNACLAALASCLLLGTRRLVQVQRAGLGSSEVDQQRPTKSFSGGWRMRSALVRVLFDKPVLLLLDEPFDLGALAWLKDHLQTWEGTLLVVSHDRSSNSTPAARTTTMGLLLSHP